jgi:outer membrane protein TolC
VRKELPRTGSSTKRVRPDILAAEAQLHAATAAVGISTANLYPQITLTASGGQQALPARAWQLFDRSGTAWSLISGLTAPSFDGGTLRADRRAAIDELHASAERYQQTVLESFGQVADVLDALNQNAGSLSAQTRALATAQSSLELSRQSYGAGNTGILQVLMHSVNSSRHSWVLCARKPNSIWTPPSSFSRLGAALEGCN